MFKNKFRNDIRISKKIKKMQKTQYNIETFFYSEFFSKFSVHGNYNVHSQEWLILIFYVLSVYNRCSTNL